MHNYHTKSYYIKLSQICNVLCDIYVGMQGKAHLLSGHITVEHVYV